VAPKLTVITPSYNQGRFIERTIRSVLDQGFPNLEYVIVDGGSTDETVEVIRRYEDRLAWWVSEPDEGQSHAINKGIEGTSSEIVAYINSDDFYLPGAFETAIAAFERSGAGWVAGASLDLLDADPPIELGVWQPEPPSRIEGPLPGRHWWLLAPWHLPQPSVFWRRRLLQRYGPFRQDMSNVFDAELMVRLAIAGEMPALLPNDVLAGRLGHAGQKSRGQARSRAEIRRFAELFREELTEGERRRLALLRWPVWGWRAVREVAIDPVLRLGGRILEHLPARLRPRIRGRDRRPSLDELRRYRKSP
jgi:glycosyltransferase involved in cell wall biosynthesis